MNTKKRLAVLSTSIIFSSTLHAQIEPMATGTFEPTWESLSQYQVPEWFRDAKFGIWAHWGPQCQPEQGDWFARFMYVEGSPEYKWFTEHYGPQSKFGFKDICNDWKGYKSATVVIWMLADVVSKNGNLLLNIPVRGDGSIDELEEKVVNDIADWMKVSLTASSNR